MYYRWGKSTNQMDSIENYQKTLQTHNKEFDCTGFSVPLSKICFYWLRFYSRIGGWIEENKPHINR